MSVERLSDAAVEALLSAHSDWALDAGGDGISRQFRFADFSAAFRVEEQVQPNARRNAIVVIALRTNVLVILEIGEVQRGLAGGAFAPLNGTPNPTRGTYCQQNSPPPPRCGLLFREIITPLLYRSPFWATAAFHSSRYWPAMLLLQE